MVPREKGSPRNCTLKKSSARPLAEVYGEEQVIDPYSTDDDVSVKSENLEEDTDDSFSDEFKSRIKTSEKYCKWTLHFLHNINFKLLQLKVQRDRD